MARTIEEYATAIQQLDGLRDTFAALDREAVQLENKSSEGAKFELLAITEAIADITRSVNDVLRQFDLKIDFGNWPADSDTAREFF